MVSQSKPEIMSAISESGTSSRSMDSAGHLPSAGGMSGLRVAGGKCGSQSDDGTEKPAGFFHFRERKLSAMSVPPLPR